MTTPSQGVIAHLSPDDAAAAIAFYEKAFGAEEVMRVPAEDGRRLVTAHVVGAGAGWDGVGRALAMRPRMAWKAVWPVRAAVLVRER